MFDAIADMKLNWILSGIIWSIALGFAAGNYACSLVHRLPRGRLILDKKPYCGSCGTMLEVRDLFPVVSALLLKHRCRYCKTPFPVSHTWTEILVGCLFVLAFFAYNFTEQYLLIVCIGSFLITLAAIQANEGMIMGRILICIIVFGALYRTLQDHSIYGFFNGGMFGMIFGALLWHKDIKPVGHSFSLPDPVKLMTVGGLCVGDKGLFAFTFLFGVFYLLDALVRKIGKSTHPPLITVAFGLAVTLVVLYPNILK
jgi:prepilin signal peptidase PulO-like enzyme (type II secretory pathway)